MLAPLNDKEMTMRPENAVRRKVIREWMSLPREKRQTQEQAATYATRVVETNAMRRREDPFHTVMAWLSPRIGRA
jgi:hypothetical protein